MSGKKETTVEIFADGACSGNPGVGGYGSILRYGKEVKEISGCALHTTNNRMELMAVIEAIRKLRRPCKIRVVTDSNYVIKGMTEWMPGWIKRDWMNSKKRPVLNKDLWEMLLELAEPHEIEWGWIRGHSGHKENERCDELARKAIKTCMEKDTKRFGHG